MLKKVRIVGFREKELQNKTGEYTFHINPEAFTHTDQILYAHASGADPRDIHQKFQNTQPPSLSFDFVLDATGIIPGVTNLIHSINEFRNVAYDYHDDIHSPNYLQVLWGKLAFDGMLSSLNVDYTLFDPSGEPLRAKLSVTFIQLEAALKQETDIKTDRGPIDLTHIKQ